METRRGRLTSDTTWAVMHIPGTMLHQAIWRFDNQSSVRPEKPASWSPGRGK